MRCTSPRTVGFYSDGKTLCWSPKKYSKEYPTFQLPCGKCISCRLENARQTAVRCVHEASLYEKNCFLTLTYSDENIGDNKLHYSHIQTFIKDLRNERFSKLLGELYPGESQKTQREAFNSLPKEDREKWLDSIRIAFFVCGEYGEKTKRAHWHLLVFNWSPDDGVRSHQNDRGDVSFQSALLAQMWPYGFSSFGTVTFESAGYCARYSAKKLVHGKDGTHDYNPISRRSCKNAIGKKWIEKNWKDLFHTGYLVFKKGDEYIQCGIPRYYEKWLKRYQPEAWEVYVTTLKEKNMDIAKESTAKDKAKENSDNIKRGYKGRVISKNQMREKILKQKFEKLQDNLKI